MHYMSDYDSKDGDQTYVRFGIKGETQINDDLTGYGRWESEFSGNKTESDSSQKTRLAFAGVKVKTTVHLTTVVTSARCTTSKHGPICSRNSAATLPRRPITL